MTLATKKIFPRLPLLAFGTFLNRLHCSLLQYREVWEVDGCKLTHKLNCKLLKKRRFASKGCRGSCNQKSDVTRKKRQTPVCRTKNAQIMPENDIIIAETLHKFAYLTFKPAYYLFFKAGYVGLRYSQQIRHFLLRSLVLSVQSETHFYYFLFPFGKT